MKNKVVYERGSMYWETYIKRYGRLAEYVKRKKQAGKTMPWVIAAVEIKKVESQTSITGNDLMRLFDRDSGETMARPRIDRIDHGRDYSINNLRWVDVSVYSKRHGPMTDFARALAKRGCAMPWVKAAGNIKHRCQNPNDKRYKNYGGRGIKCRITSSELFVLFQRDGARFMKQPSVDRIDNDGDYCIGNVRWIEMSENRKKGHSDRRNKKTESARIAT